ncbi:hypothetical protein Tco_0255127 [Tanacetum coccineum]
MMSNISEDIQSLLLKGQFKWETVVETLAEGTEGALHRGPERARVFGDLSAEDKERYKADIRATNILLQVYLNGVRSITEVKLNMRFSQPTNDPLALVSNSSNQKYPTQSLESPQSSNQPSLVDNFQLDSGSTSTDNLIESLTNTLTLLIQSYKLYLPQTNNQLRTSSNARNKATVQDDRVVVQHVRGRYNVNNQGRPFQRNYARGVVRTGNVGGIGHIARESPQPKRPQDSDYFKDKMLLMHAHENGAVLNEEQLVFLAGEQVTNFDDDVDDLTLNDDHVFEADQCDVLEFDVDEGPTTQTMFMANLTSKEARASYDSNIPSEVQDREYNSDCEDKYHEVHEMQSDVQHNYVVVHPC